MPIFSADLLLNSNLALSRLQRTSHIYIASDPAAQRTEHAPTMEQPLILMFKANMSCEMVNEWQNGEK